MAGPHHRTPQYRKTSAAIVCAARDNPDTRCWRCGLTIAEHPNQRSGRPPTWQAGHLIAGQLNGPLAPEVSTCNQADPRNKRAEPHSRTW